MKRRRQIFAGAALVAAAGVIVLAGIAGCRLWAARVFAAAQQVRLADGNTIVVAAREVTVGAVGSEYAVLVYVVVR